jgi:hypothetical protein
MMNDPMKMKQDLLEELMEHLSGAQAGDLKKMLEEQKAKSMGGEMDPMTGKPKALKIESIELMGGKKPMDDEGHSVADNSGKTLGEAIGYPGTAKKSKPTAMLGSESQPDDPGQGDDDKEMDDDELKELLKKYSMA